MYNIDLEFRIDMMLFDMDEIHARSSKIDNQSRNHTTNQLLSQSFFLLLT